MATGINLDGAKDVLGLWITQTEGAMFWLSVVTELKNRGVLAILIACVDGLKGFPEAIEAVFPPGRGAIMHRAPGAPQLEPCTLKEPQGGGR